MHICNIHCYDPPDVHHIYNIHCYVPHLVGPSVNIRRNSFLCCSMLGMVVSHLLSPMLFPNLIVGLYHSTCRSDAWVYWPSPSLTRHSYSACAPSTGTRGPPLQIGHVLGRLLQCGVSSTKNTRLYWTYSTVLWLSLSLSLSLSVSPLLLSLFLSLTHTHTQHTHTHTHSL
jgi:hypothetical protein